jgi:hypothetical protein
MMAARDADGRINPNVAETESHRRYTGILAQIESSTSSFQEWLTTLNPSTRERVEIRTYLECPTTTYVFIDRDEPDGFVQVELLLYGTHVRDLPHYILTKKRGGPFFDIHCQSFNRLWDKSQVLVATSE